MSNPNYPSPAAPPAGTSLVPFAGHFGADGKFRSYVYTEYGTPGAEALLTEKPATDSKLDTLHSDLSTILSEMRDDQALSESVWTDDTGAYYIRRVIINQDTGAITVSYTTAAGGAYTPGANPRPANATQSRLIQFAYETVAAGSGYSVGDIIQRIIILAADNSIASSMWINASTGLVMGSAPTAANIRPADETDLSAVVSGIGAQADAAAGSDIAAASEIALMKRLLQKMTTLIGLLPAALVSGRLDVNLGAATSSNLTPARSVVSSSGSVAAGAQAVGFKNIGTTTVTLLGVNLLAGEPRTVMVPYPFKLGAIAYNASGGSLEIIEVR